MSDTEPSEDGPPKLVALSALRHQCAACGHCCHGHRVRVEDDDERARVELQAAQLGIADPIVDSALRTIGGGCVFLDERQLCRIHGAFGGDQKPNVCRQYPLRVAITERGIRVGIDPGCTNNWRVWKTGTVIPFESLVRPHDNRREPGDPTEAQLLQLAGLEGMTVAGLSRRLARMGGARLTTPDDDLPDGYAERLVARLKAQNIARFLAAPAVGDGIRACFAHLPAFTASLDVAPAWPGRLDADSDGFTLEVLRRHLFQRVGDEPLPDAGQAVVLLAGAVACAWADPRPEVFGPALSSWAKAMRHRAFWAALVPRPETLMWLMTGQQGG